MCERCRWNDHDTCRGWLGQGRRMRCLCRTCLDQRLAKPSSISLDERPAADRTTDVTERATRPGRPGRPHLVLIRGGAYQGGAGRPTVA